MEISEKIFMQLIVAATRNLDWQRFGQTLATTNPEVFVATLAEMDGIENDDPWKNEVRDMVEVKSPRLDIIKYIRDNSGMGLAESREWFDENYPDVNLTPNQN